jgi:hypothetical protein
MNIENSNFYLKKTTWIFIVGLLLMIYSMGYSYLWSIKVIQSFQTWHSYIYILLYSFVFWGLIGKILNSTKNALICFGASLISLIYNVLSHQYFGDIEIYKNPVILLSNLLFYMIPFFVFGYLEFKNIKAALVMSLAIVLEISWSGNSMTNFSAFGLDKILNWLFDIDITSYIISTIHCVSFVIKCVLFCELYRFCKKKITFDKLNWFLNDLYGTCVLNLWK